MRWCTYTVARRAPMVGLVRDGEVFGLAPPATLIEVVRSPEAAEDARQRALSSPSEVHPLAEVQLLAPVPVPPSVRDFMAFEEHIVAATIALGLQVDPTWYEIPVFYFSNPAAVQGPYEDVAISPGSAAFDFELEIAAVIGLPGSDIDPTAAEAHVAGYTVLCDWSARDLQQREQRLNLGPAKGKDSATSLGPFLVSADELEPYRKGKAYDLEMTASVNGRQYSKGNFSTIHWGFPELIAHASRGTELRTGDVIGSGTVGTGCILELSRTHGLDAYPWLRPGDSVVLEVEHLGSIAATVRPSRVLG
jgi:2-keto-4-pentenoate hydratase/2-oxohepta-3-ene-1,7-dioic acid hydratase in catechol pathway